MREFPVGTDSGVGTGCGVGGVYVGADSGAGAFTGCSADTVDVSTAQHKSSVLRFSIA